MAAVFRGNVTVKQAGGTGFPSDSQPILEGMTLGLTPLQQDLIQTTTGFCEPLVAPDSIYGLLHRECHCLFPDEVFADLFCDVGRRSVPPMIVEVVMVLQRLEGCSDREAVERFCFDARWKYAAGGLRFDYPGFVHTVLVDMRARLQASEDPDRIFRVTLDAAKRAGVVGRRRVLDSTPIYDAVATMDTVTLVRSGIRGLLAACDRELEQRLRGVLARDDDYRGAGKPVCDWEDRQAREDLVDALANDAIALLEALEGICLGAGVAKAATMLAALVGQDLECEKDGVFRIARGVAKNRIISTVDPDARHGHKTSARGFDGFKGHVAIDPDTEIITATTVTAGNVGDAAAASGLLADDLPGPDGGEAERDEQAEHDDDGGSAGTGPERLSVYGDSAYGVGELLSVLEQADAENNCKVQTPHAPGGLFAKNEFQIDLGTGTVACPAGHTVALISVKSGQIARFGALCSGCPLAARCTNSNNGRTIHAGPHERHLAAARERQANPAWQADYKATRPKIERKIAHMMRRKHGGRRARVRGKPKVTADFSLLAAATNLARLAVLGLTRAGREWAISSG